VSVTDSCVCLDQIRWLTRGKDILDDAEALEKSDLLMELQFSIPELVDALMVRQNEFGCAVPWCTLKERLLLVGCELCC
jgi:hypothetical protein